MYLILPFYCQLGLHKSQISEDYALGDRVLVAGLRRGTIRFIGETQFAPGKSSLNNCYCDLL